MSVRCFLEARLAGTGLLCTPTVYSGSAPNGYTNNLGVTWATVMLSMGQWCAYSAQGRHKQCTVLLEQPASHSYMYLYTCTSAGTWYGPIVYYGTQYHSSRQVHVCTPLAGVGPDAVGGRRGGPFEAARLRTGRRASALHFL